MDRETFREQVELALAHIRDIVHLRGMDLDVICLSEELPRSQRGWELSRYLLERLERLRPASEEAGEWAQRRYEVLAARYVSGLSPDGAADKLAVSRRHFYRLLQRALDDFAAFLWAEVADQEPEAGDQPFPDTHVTQEPELDLLRHEAELLGSRQQASLPEVLQSVLDVLDPLLEARSVSLDWALPEQLPAITLRPEILKQFLLAVMGDLLDCDPVQSISLSAQVCAKTLEVGISVQVRPSEGPGPELVSEQTSQKASVRLALLHGASLGVTDVSPDGFAYQVVLPTLAPRTVLVVDDNQEVCLLFRRYLTSGGFQALVTTTGADAIAVARSQDLYAIILDLMMSDEDGWDVLQKLTHDPQTYHLPVIICTVLDHADLALSLGAKAFLKKPVSRHGLLNALADLDSLPCAAEQQSPG